MKNRILPALLAALALTLTACSSAPRQRPSSSEAVSLNEATAAISSIHTTISTNSSHPTTRNESTFRDLEFDSLSAYRDTMFSIVDLDVMKKLFVRHHPEYAMIIIREGFSMVLQDRFFLLPQLPKGYTVSAFKLNHLGYSEMVLQHKGKEIGVLIINHHISDSEDRKTEYSTVYVRGKPIQYTQTGTQDTCVGYIGFWKEQGEYTCNASLNCDFASFEAFLKDLIFEKINIPQSGEG